MITREQIEQHARSGRKIQAIKDYRELTRSGLAESKSAVEDFIAYGRWGAQTPFAAVAAPARRRRALLPRRGAIDPAVAHPPRPR
ncbi:MAG: hypothetical protein IPK80_36220 [Nannocystis sp.]|nr:hypothetical protein [Nannocystis sp.]